MYRDLNFTNGTFKKVWVEDANGKMFASFDCSNFNKAKAAAKTLTDILNTRNNNTHCCIELPTKEAELSELEKLVEQQSNSDIKLFKKDGYIGGFCDGFRLYSNWLRTKLCKQKNSHL